MSEPEIETFDATEAVDLGDRYAWHSQLTLRDLRADGYGDCYMAKVHEAYLRRYQRGQRVMAEVIASLQEPTCKTG